MQKKLNLCVSVPDCSGSCLQHFKMTLIGVFGKETTLLLEI